MIGIDNDLPWHIPDDLKRFKAITTGKPVIMGRKTFESIFDRLGKPLPGRDNIVISRSTSFDYDRTVTVKTIEEAVEQAQKIAQNLSINEVFCVGGAQIYTQMIDRFDRIYLTLVHQKYNGNAFFPEFMKQNYSVIENERFVLSQTDGKELAYSFVTYEKAV